jgi:nicotinate-nucleotide pyrophosphorylase (carboxylating)
MGAATLFFKRCDGAQSRLKQVLAHIDMNPSPSGLPAAEIDAQVAAALAEDVGTGDVTASLIGAQVRARATVIAREPLVLCGREWFDAVFARLDRGIEVRWLAEEGADVAADAVLCELRGPARALLTGERTALNFLQLLSGVATETRRYARALEGTACQVLDTRKTVPGLRNAQKYAVRCGGGRNHRHGLYDMVLLKENHIVSAGSITAAVGAARAQAPGIPVEVEVESLQELREALTAEPDVIMLDDFDLATLREAVQLARAARPAIKLEASGSVSLERLRELAGTGVDYVSVGALTKHVRAIDLSMRFTFE